jgi:hypothetical protein
MTIGAGAAGVDYTLTFNGETSDGVLTWMEDEDYFEFDNDIKVPYISTGANEFLATDIIRHTITAQEAIDSEFTESWDKATQAKIVDLSAIVVDISQTPDIVSKKWEGMNIYYNGTTLNVSTAPSWGEGDIVTIKIIYEK